MSETPPPRPDRFDYFMVRVRRLTPAPGEPAPRAASGFSAVVERIGTGEKREVASSEQLARVMEEWSR